MFLLRMMFWLAVVVLLLPAAEDTRPAESLPVDNPVTIFDAVDAASVAVSDMADFCDRNQSVCETGSAAWSLFLRKAEYGAGLVYRLTVGGVQDSANPGSNDVNVRDAIHTGTNALSPSRDTLIDIDRQPAWQGPDGGKA